MPTTGPLVAIGASSLIWQVASARAILSGLYGNELALGLILGSWLLLIGLATAGAGWRAAAQPGRQEALLATLLRSMPLFILASLALQHHTLPAYAAPGLLLGPGKTAGLVLLCLAPPCLALGGAFGLLSRLGPAEESAGGRAGRIYLLESLGTVAAGLIFHFGLALLPLSAAGLTAGALCWLAGLDPRLWRQLGPTPAVRFGALVPLLAGAAALFYLAAPLLLPGMAALEPQVPGYQLLARESSPHAALTVLRRGDQLLFTANGQVLFTNQQAEQAQALVHPALLAHPQPRQVLMVSGGLGGGLAEALRHPLTRLDYVELDAQLVALARRYGGPTISAPLDDPRVQLIISDGRQLIERSRDRYDVIVIGLSGPSSALTNRFYTIELFRAARRALRPGGVLQLALAGSEGYLPEELALAHASIRATLLEVFGQAEVLPGQPALLLARRGAPLELPPEVLLTRLRERGLDLRYFGQSEIMARTLDFARDHYLDRLAEISPQLNTDLYPAAYFQSALRWLALSSPGTARTLLGLMRQLAGQAWLVVGGALLLALLWGGLRGRRAAGLTMLVVGLCGMALELCVILASQAVRGVIYLELGALLTAFMLGLTAGAPLGRWLVGRLPQLALSVASTACALAALILLGLLSLAPQWAELSLALYLLGLTQLGLTVGACYPAAAQALAERQPLRAPARAYAWDMAGGALGALAAVALLLPLLGIPGTCLLCAALCLGLGLTVWR